MWSDAGEERKKSPYNPHHHGWHVPLPSFFYGAALASPWSDLGSHYNDDVDHFIYKWFFIKCCYCCSKTQGMYHFLILGYLWICSQSWSKSKKIFDHVLNKINCIPKTNTLSKIRCPWFFFKSRQGKEFLKKIRFYYSYAAKLWKAKKNFPMSRTWVKLTKRRPGQKLRRPKWTNS